MQNIDDEAVSRRISRFVNPRGKHQAEKRYLSRGFTNFCIRGSTEESHGTGWTELDGTESEPAAIGGVWQNLTDMAISPRVSVKLQTKQLVPSAW